MKAANNKVYGVLKFKIVFLPFECFIVIELMKYTNGKILTINLIVDWLI